MRIVLISMPFARIEFPSLALTQLKSMVEQTHGAQAEVEVHYLNHDFAAFIGVEPNQMLTDMSMNNGIGEWFFRQVAFPDLPDNTIEFFQRTFPKRDADARRFRAAVLEKRQRLSGFLEEMIRLYALDQADVLGFTSMFSQNVASIALARLVKLANPNCVTVVGGANCEYPMGAVIARNIACLDYIFSGPALSSFSAFIGHLLGGDHAACAAIPGIFTRENATAPNPKPIGAELPLNTPIALDYDSFMDRYQSLFGDTHYRPSLLFETSRGCWWGEKAHCTFCGLNGLTMAYRAMAPDLAITQIGLLFEAYAPQGAQFQAVDNILPKSYLADVLPKLRTPLETTLFYEVKSDLSDADVETLDRARVKFIQPGIEALSTQTLKRMKKGSTAFQNIALLKNCALYDIDPAWNLLVGFPGEPASVFEKYMQDLPLMGHLPAPIGVAPVRFDRYSPYFTKAAEYGLLLQPFDFYRMTYPFTEADLADLAYYFYDDNVDAPYIADVAAWINPLRAVVGTWRTRWSDLDVRPDLYIDAAGLLVDTRDGPAVPVALPPDAGVILALLQSPRTEPSLMAELKDRDVQGVLSWARARRLLFTEHDRMISLVLPRKPAIPERHAKVRNPAAVIA